MYLARNIETSRLMTKREESPELETTQTHTLRLSNASWKRPFEISFRTTS